MSETMEELKKKRKTDIAELMEHSREVPAMQAEIGWRCLMCAHLAGIQTYGDLLDKIEKKDEEDPLFQEIEKIKEKEAERLKEEKKGEEK